MSLQVHLKAAKTKRQAQSLRTSARLYPKVCNELVFSGKLEPAAGSAPAVLSYPAVGLLIELLAPHYVDQQLMVMESSQSCPRLQKFLSMAMYSPKLETSIAMVKRYLSVTPRWRGDVVLIKDIWRHLSSARVLMETAEVRLQTKVANQVPLALERTKEGMAERQRCCYGNEEEARVAECLITVKKRREVLSRTLIEVIPGREVALQDANDNFLAEKRKFAAKERDYQNPTFMLKWAEKRAAHVAKSEAKPGKSYQAQHTLWRYKRGSENPEYTLLSGRREGVSKAQRAVKTAEWSVKASTQLEVNTRCELENSEMALEDAKGALARAMLGESREEKEKAFNLTKKLSLAQRSAIMKSLKSRLPEHRHQTEILDEMRTNLADSIKCEDSYKRILAPLFGPFERVGRDGRLKIFRAYFTMKFKVSAPGLSDDVVDTILSFLGLAAPTPNRV
jgi:hypothetical protein